MNTIVNIKGLFVMRITLIIVILFFSLMSCSRNEKTFDQGYEYYPLAIGDYKIYNVQKIKYTVLDTVFENYQIKELIKDTITLGSELKYRVERYKRLSSADSWPLQPDSVWTAVRESSKIVRTENNIRYVKLVFPIENGKTWNGNAENAFGVDNYNYDAVGKNYSVSGNVYANTATVIHSPNDSNLVSKDFRKEVFAKDIGLIQKVQETYAYHQSNGSLDSIYRIDNGVKYYENLVYYGK